MRQRGFAMLLVLLTLAIVGGLVWEITVWTRGRAISTTNALRDAQIEQLMLAGMDAAPAMLHNEQQHLELAVPEELGAHLTLDRVSGASQVRITVEYCGIQRQQTAAYNRSGDTWRLAELTP